jgi:Cu-Zn family superoxide dismutase
MHNPVLERRHHVRRRHRRPLGIIAAAGLLTAGVATTVGDAHAAPLGADVRKPAISTYTLSTNQVEVYPEGVAVHGSTYYVTTFGTGEIFRGELGRPEAEVFHPYDGFGPASGIKVIGDRLLVARGYGGNVTLHDRATGEILAGWTNHLWPDPTNVNDIAITPNGDAYITDSDRSVLYRIPAAELRRPSAPVQDLPVFLDWTGTPFPHIPGAVNGNGIVATPDGKYLLVVHFDEGRLFRVRVSDKQVTQVDLGGYSLTGGDGMVLTDDNVLYVVRIFDSLVAKLRVNGRYDTGRLLSETTDPSFHGPTTAAIGARRMLVVNSEFTGPPSGPPWTVSSIPLP